MITKNALRILLSENASDQVKKLAETVLREYDWDANYDKVVARFPTQLYKIFFDHLMKLRDEKVTDIEILRSETFRIAEEEYGTDYEEVEPFLKVSLAPVNTRFAEQYTRVLKLQLESNYAEAGLKKIREIGLKIDSASSVAKQQLLEEYNQLISSIHEEQRLNKSVNSAEGLDTLLIGDDTDDVFDLLFGIQEDLLNTTKTIQTGLPILPEVYSAELVILGATTGGFKSGSLLNIAESIRENVKDPVLKNPDAVPFFLYVSFENRPKITGRRLVTFYSGLTTDEFKHLDAEQVRDIGKEIKSRKVQLAMEYRTAFSTSKEELIAMALNRKTADGRPMECIGMGIDYLLLSNYSKHVEYRIALSEESRKYADMAIELDIPVITLVQLNKLSSIAKELTVDHIAESKAIADHADRVKLFRMQKCKPILPDDVKDRYPTGYVNFLEAFDAKHRNAENVIGHRELISFRLNNSFRMATESDINEGNSLFSVMPEEELHAMLDEKYKIESFSDSEQSRKDVNKGFSAKDVKSADGEKQAFGKVVIEEQDDDEDYY